MANNNIPITSTGPALGNVPTPDSYLRLKQNIDGLQARVAQVAALAQVGGPLTGAQLEQIRAALQASGPNPLNLTALPGQTLQPQKGLVPSVITLPLTGTDGQVVFYRHVIWRFTAATHRWSPVSTIVIFDYGFNLSNYPASQYAPGVLFITLDSNVSFVEEDVASGSSVTPTWTPLYSETVCYPHADRYSTGTCNTTASNNNFIASFVSGNAFQPEWVGQQIWINGNLYGIIGKNGSNLTLAGNAGTQNAANFTFEFASLAYPLGALFYETDRSVFYYCGNAAGTVSAANNNNITWQSGVKFDPYWAGSNISIAGNLYPVVSVAQNKLAMTINAGNNVVTGNALSYAVPRGAWVYASGIMQCNNGNDYPADLDVATDLGFYVWDKTYTVMRQAQSYNNNNALQIYFGYQWGKYVSILANIPPQNNNGGFSVLSPFDNGFLFYATDVLHAFEFGSQVSNNWNFSPGDPGSAYIVAGGGSSPVGGLWALCDGSVVSVTTSAGGTTPFTTPNLTGNAFVMAASNAAYTGNQKNATSPTWSNNAATDNVTLTASVSLGNNATTDSTSLAGNFTASSVTLNYSTGISSQIVITGVNTSVAMTPDPHTHGLSGVSPTGSVTPNPHHHTLSNNNAILNPPSEANNGLPLRIALSWWLRR